MADVAMRHVDEGFDGASLKRKRTSPSPGRDDPPQRRRRSPSPPARVRIEVPRVVDADPVRKRERERQLALQAAEAELREGAPKEKPEFDAQAEFQKLISSRSGGVYMPPARLRALQEAAGADKSSAEYQRLSWDALRKSITGIVNRVNITNIKMVVPELFAENLVRGRGLFCRSIMKAQAASLPFTPVFAALVAIINTKLPQVGELLVHRLISQFRRSFKRNDKSVCHATTTFLAHLVNQQVVSDLVALQMLFLLLERPTDDSVEIAVGIMREVGAFLSDAAPKANNGVFERFRAVLHEGTIDKRVQYMIEVLFQVRKDKYKDNPILPEGLDLVEEEEQITHMISLDDDLPIQEGLNIFKFDPNYLENEEKYKEIKAEILGEGSDEEDDDEEEGESDDEDGEGGAVPDKEGIEDRTGTNLVNLRRVIYLTIMNALSYEEAVHKLMKVNIDEGQEIELCNMIIECCSQERSYSNFYGLIGERFCKLNRVWCESFETAFTNYFDTIHRYETNRLRNIARFFGHLLASDSISWAVFSVVKMNEDDTTSSSRIFVKILLQEMSEALGLKTLAERFNDPTMTQYYANLFPLDNPKNTRFSINYFTSIGLGVVTEKMREHLKNAPRLIMEQRQALLEKESSSSDTDSDSDDDSEEDDSDSDVSSEESPPRRSGRDARSPRARRFKDESMSPPPPPRSSGRREPSRDDRRRRDDLRYRSPTPPRDRDRNGGGRGRGEDSERRYGRERSPPARYRSPVRRDDRSPPRDSAPRSRLPPRRSDRSPPPRDDSPPPNRLPPRRDEAHIKGRVDDTPPRSRRPARSPTPPTPPTRAPVPSRRDATPPTPPRRRRRDSYEDRRDDRDRRRRYDSGDEDDSDDSRGPRRTNGRDRDSRR